MPVIDLADLKRHMNIAADDATDDTLLKQKIAAAETMIGNAIGKPLTDFLSDAAYANTVPADLLESVRQLSAHLFEQREAVAFGVTAETFPYSVADMVGPYRKWVF